jgi:hypothetical protein
VQFACFFYLGKKPSGVGGLRAMRNWFLVMALVALLLVEVLWPQSPSVKADSRYPNDVILDAMGGEPVAERSISRFLLGQDGEIEETADGGHLNALIDAATHSRTYASSIFGYAQGLDGNLAGALQRGEAFASSNSNRQARQEKHADSGRGKIDR